MSETAGANLHPWFERYVGGTDELPWDETLRLAGLRLILSAAAGEDGREYRVEEMLDPTVEQRRVREGWLSGRVSAESGRK